MKILCFDEGSINQYFIDKNLKLFDVEFSIIEQRLYFQKPDTTIAKIKLNQWTNINDYYFMGVEDNYYAYKHTGKILITSVGDIKIPTNILIINNRLIINNESVVYVNYQVVKEHEVQLSPGDVIIIGNIVFTYQLEMIVVWGEPLVDSGLELIEEHHFVNPIYEKSPRMIHRFKEKTIELLNPPGKERISKNTIAKIIIPSLISILSTGLMAYFMRRGIFVIIAAITTVCSLTFSITSYIQEKKQIKNENRKRKEKYNNYLLEQRKELYRLYNSELEIYNYNFPSAVEISNLINNFSSRIYERDVYDDDFLEVSMGYSTQKPHYQLKFNENVLDLDEDLLMERTKDIYNQYLHIEDVKYSVDLKKNHVGIIGENRLVFDEIKRLILEICCFQSYHDVNIILLYSLEYKQEFQFATWLKHVKLRDVNVTANIYNNKIKEQVLSSLYQILKQRAMQVKEDKGEHEFSPHYVMYIDDMSLIVNHPIMEYLQSDLNLGISLIIRVNQFSDLPANIKTVFVAKDKYNLDLILLDGEKQMLRLRRDQIDNIDLDECARNLAILDHQIGISNSIPDMVSFLEMYQVETVEELNIINRWQEANIHKSIAVPLGLRGENDIVYLNLHEKAHGPHGLVAGTTGSGKSEIIQTYILSLAVNFSPYEVGFLLIDFKGGGMANLFKDLPHLIGTITNLDGAESMRALASIKSELKRRQRIFNENDVNNINLYNKLFKQNPELEPLPHLFIISDEFAELKKEQPEFMDELVSVARIGRTLGVHLILATQKPTGVVNDQIWSNSKFKLALKVQDESDSKEILKTPDAAYITKTGRAYLQVGNNEIYELFQSAWSGANYDLDAEVGTDEIDRRVYQINELGQKELLNEDLSDDSNDKNMLTELDVVVDYIKHSYDGAGYNQVKKAWLPSLKEMIPNPNVEGFDFIDLSTLEEVNLNVSIGIVDVPDEQYQKEVCVDMKEDSNIVIYGSSGYGKSSFLTNLVLDMSVKNNPENLIFYILDLGNAGLVGLKNLVHVADYINFNSLDKISKLMNKINRIVQQRKNMLSDNAAQNITVLERITGEQIQRIVIVIDNYDGIKELDESVSKFFELITRDGPSLGIYVVMSAMKSGSIKTAITNNLKNKYTLYQNDKSEYSVCVGKTRFALNEQNKGRALIKLSDVYQMQIYTPFEFIDLIEFNDKMSEFIKMVNDKYTGEVPKPIPVIPDNFTSKDLSNYDYENDNVTNNILGVTTSDVLKIGMSQLPSLFVILGPNKSGKTNVIKLLINQQNYPPFIIDSSHNVLINYKNNPNFNYVGSNEEFNDFCDKLTNEIETRINDAEVAFESGEVRSYQEYYQSIEEKSVFIDDVDDFINTYNGEIDVGRLVKDAINVGIKFVIGVNSVSKKAVVSSNHEDLIKLAKTSVDYLVLGTQSTFSIVTIPTSKTPRLGYGILGTNGELISIRIPFQEEEK